MQLHVLPTFIWMNLNIDCQYYSCVFSPNITLIQGHMMWNLFIALKEKSHNKEDSFAA